MSIYSSSKNNALSTALFFTFTILVMMTGCIYEKQNNQFDMERIRRNFEEVAKKSNEAALASAKEKSEIMNLALTNPDSAIHMVDKKLDAHFTLDKFEIFELLLLKGSIYSDMDSLPLALEAFSQATYALGEEHPKLMVAKANVLIKMKKMDEAYSLLTQATAFDIDYIWQLGNYFEIIKNKTAAINTYEDLYKKDTIRYQSCKQRIEILKENNPKYLERLDNPVFENRGIFLFTEGENP